MQCYHFEEILPCESGTGKLDPAVDMTYILTLEGSERSKTILSRLQEAGMVSVALIQFNKGYNCEGKKLGRKASVCDLTHALTNALQHATDNGYENILVLEDDFIFNPIHYDDADLERVCEFISGNDHDLYNLGPITFISYPVSWYHRRSLRSFASHAIIYNRSAFRPFIRYAKQVRYDIPCDKIQDDLGLKVYFYHKPISYQLITRTENRDTGGALCPYWITYYMGLEEDPSNYVLIFGAFYYLTEFLILSIIVLIIISYSK